MRSSYRSWIVPVLVALVAAACQQRAAEQEPAEPAGDTVAVEARTEQQAIDTLRVRYERAFESADAGAIASLYTEDAILHVPDEEPVRGREAVRGVFEETFADSLTDVSFTIEPGELVIADAGDVAYGTGTTTFSATTPAGESITERSRYLVAFEKVDGEWKLDAAVSVPTTLEGSGPAAGPESPEEETRPTESDTGSM
ncbi:MAG: SgcJ/EcaC family oxidoreductase [Gemmatimonadota bacterium]|nr:SgcJ/EcaC family oxidoreductase [Gemmatimonadota bacterium]